MKRLQNIDICTDDWIVLTIVLHQVPTVLCNVAVGVTSVQPIVKPPFKLTNDWATDAGLLDFQTLIDDQTMAVILYFCSGAGMRSSPYELMWLELFKASAQL